MKTISVLAHPNAEEIDLKIKEILSRGKAVRFTNTETNITKDVKEFNKDEMGDFIAFRQSGGQTHYVCPYALEYVISEVEI
jgi:hypothetical protein